MLRYRINKSDFKVDSKGLDVVSMHEVKYDNDMYDGQKTYEVLVENVYNIRSGSHICGISDVTVNNYSSEESEVHSFYTDVVVSDVSVSDNSFVFRVPSEISLNCSAVMVESRYHEIRMDGNSWGVFEADHEWFESNPSAVMVSVNQAAYGKNLVSGNTVVFYYENYEWKTIEFDGKDNMEGCLKDGKISFNSFHEYDKSERPAVKLEEGKTYYTKENYLVFYFIPTHYFCRGIEKNKIKEMEGRVESEITEYGRPIVETVEYPDVYFYVKRNDGSTMKIKSECHLDSNNSVSVFNIISNFNIYVDDNWEQIKRNDYETFLNRLFYMGFDSVDGYIPRQEGTSGGFEIKRENNMYDTDKSVVNLSFDYALNTIQIPISQKFGTDMNHNDAIKDKFVDMTVSGMINPILDMEKDVYVPSIITEGKAYEECFRIIFNLHFRKHRDIGNEKWASDRDDYWNGTRFAKINGTEENKNVLDLEGRVYSYDFSENDKIAKTGKHDYFSYFGVNPVINENTDLEENYITEDKNYNEFRKGRSKYTEYQSDLLSYLGFSNDDVKYQKSKLKKSFLRLLFFDSDNIANQNLLHTATIFIDSGELFSKYIKNIDTDCEYKNGDGDFITEEEFSLLSDEDKEKCIITGEPTALTGSSAGDIVTVYDKYGVRVNREPMRKDCIGDIGSDIDDIERLRLSSQISVTDKYSSNRSSEGFYFYTYKGNDNGVMPTELYMRVEFNHAGYGRVIPFMMPYIRDDEEKSGRYSGRNDKIKTFDDICYDWSAEDISGELGSDGHFPLKKDDKIGYGPVRYMKYCHIKWKYRYDKDTQKHIYYLDPDVYGDGVKSGNGHGNNIILNLYEGKIK